MATPARHAPAHLDRGPVIGFVLSFTSAFEPTISGAPCPAMRVRFRFATSFRAGFLLSSVAWMQANGLPPSPGTFTWMPSTSSAAAQGRSLRPWPAARRRPGALRAGTAGHRAGRRPMSPGRVSERIVTARVGWVREMIARIRALPLDDLSRHARCGLPRTDPQIASSRHPTVASRSLTSRMSKRSGWKSGPTHWRISSNSSCVGSNRISSIRP